MFHWRTKSSRLKPDSTCQAALDRLQQFPAQRLLQVPFEDCRFVVLDTETTGFGVYSGDAIVSVAMVEMQGKELTGRHYNQLINPLRPIPERSRQIHGIDDQQVKDAPTLVECLPEILEFMHEALLVGHHTWFDIRFFNKTIKDLGGKPLPHPWVDTLLLYLGLSGRLGHYSLEEVAAFCKVTVTDRHTALGDARTTAGLFQYLAPRLCEPHEPVRRLLAQQSDGSP